MVALHVESSALSDWVPCTWGQDGLAYLGLVRNAALKGPLPECFATVADEVIINISDNDPASPFCGSGSQEHPIAKQLPKCSTIDGIDTVCCRARSHP